MEADPIGVITLGAGIITLVGSILIRDRQLLRIISEGDEKLHVRLNRAQDIFVRRDDLNGHIQTIENTVNQMREEQRETNRRIDSLLTELTKRNNHDKI